MDFGFSRFLEMFEERFGRRMTTCLVALIGLALSIYSIKVVIDGSREFYALLSASFTWQLGGPILLQAVSFVLSIALSWIIMQSIWKFYFVPRLSRLRTELQNSYSDLERRTGEITATFEDNKAKLAELQAELTLGIKEWEDRSIAREIELDEIQAEITKKLEEGRALLERGEQVVEKAEKVSRELQGDD
jgi:hypothetical protein